MRRVAGGRVPHAGRSAGCGGGGGGGRDRGGGGACRLPDSAAEAGGLGAGKDHIPYSDLFSSKISSS